MARHGDPVELSTADMKAYTKGLEMMITMIEGDIERLEKAGKKSIQPQLWRSAKLAEENLRKFTGAVRVAVLEEVFPDSEVDAKTRVKPARQKSKE